MSDSRTNPKISSPIACSIIIPTRDQLEFLRPCVESIFRTTTRQNIEVIIVDNGSTDEETLNYLSTLRGDPRVVLLDWPKPFNFSAINNFAAQQASSDILCLLNNDIEIRDEQWLEKLLPLAKRTDVGAVGCTLLYPDGKIQHGGIALHEHEIAKHIAVGEPADYFNSHGIALPCAVDAVTAACLLIRKSLFLRLGGFNATRLAVAFNDVDLCLRLGEKGLPILCHQGVQLVHHESVSRKSDALPSNRARAEKEFAYMHHRWQYRLIGNHYKSGIPPEITQQYSATNQKQPTLDELIARTTDNLYLGNCSENDSLPVLDTDYQEDIPNWQNPYLELQADFENLLAHTRRIEQAHWLIENSIFWRMTAPLRWLKGLIIREGRRHLPLQTTPDADDADELDAQPEPGAPVIAVADSKKDSYDYSAKKQFAAFLQSDSTLSFPLSERPQISIILVFYNQAHLSFLCLQSILQNADVSFELIIVDNESRDETSELLARVENAKIIQNTDNKGFVIAVNQGLQLCRGEFVLLFNNDALLEPDALSSAVAVFDEEPNTGAVGAKIKMLDGALQEAGSIIWNDGACLGYGRGADPSLPEFQFRREVDYCSGAFLLFRKQICDELGGFDEAYAPAYYEESDFCIRLQKRGLRVIYNPSTQITHYEFASSGGLQGASKLQAAHRQILCERHQDYLAKKYSNNPQNTLAARTNNNYANVLIIDDRVPHPSLGAGYPRAAHMLNFLSSLELNISFYPLLFPKDDWKDINASLDNRIEVILNHGKSELGKFLVERKGFYQYIMISRSHNMEFFNFVVNLAPEVIDNIRIIYDAEAVTAPRDFLMRKVFRKPVPEKEQHAILRKELDQARIADMIVTVSEREAALYKNANFANIAIVGHTINPSATPLTFSDRKNILFVGALRDDASPNVDSLLWFIINVLPLIAASIPDIKLHVVGDNTAPSLAAIELDNVRFHGRMEAIDTMYDACRIFIAPTRFAAGIPHKVHEAAANGIPSVTTSLLAKQLGWFDEKQLLTADAPRDFADQCIRLYQNESLWQMLRDYGLKAIDEDCSAEKFNLQLAMLFDQAGS